MLEPFQIIKSEWENINLGIQKAKHDYHSFVFSTVSKNSPDSRTVILRDFDEHQPAIWFHSDRRSKKILHLKENEKVSGDHQIYNGRRFYGVGSTTPYLH